MISIWISFRCSGFSVPGFRFEVARSGPCRAHHKISGTSRSRVPVPAPGFWVVASGRNYPEKFSQKKMLPYYAERLETVEINCTFYRLPTERLLARWSASTPPGVTFRLKAGRRVTHDARFQNCEELTRVFCEAAESLREPARGLAVPASAVVQEVPVGP